MALFVRKSRVKTRGWNPLGLNPRTADGISKNTCTQDGEVINTEQWRTAMRFAAAQENKNETDPTVVLARWGTACPTTLMIR
ncbi:hypothetical protein [Mesorhizobium carmichaelinearum]|uniref:hypothetical protein n=1 Tax=Mesorhizobium carmichaelinearum TaxID=1208188 RepID=UPI001180707D|nr:hypothetical protein [Mesorhizobium carmichaelinearum]